MVGRNILEAVTDLDRERRGCSPVREIRYNARRRRQIGRARLRNAGRFGNRSAIRRPYRRCCRGRRPNRQPRGRIAHRGTASGYRSQPGTHPDKDEKRGNWPASNSLEYVFRRFFHSLKTERKALLPPLLLWLFNAMYWGLGPSELAVGHRPADRQRFRNSLSLLA